MANYSELKRAIASIVRTNNNQEITGAALQNVLMTMVNSLGNGYQFVGVATPTTNPGAFDQNVFYLAAQGGIYSNFGGLVVTQGFNVLKLNGSTWSVEQLVVFDDEPTAGSDNLVKSRGVVSWSEENYGKYIENPEFVYAKTDAQDRILWAIKSDGTVYYGAGIPTQVVEYINKKIAELSLDEYEDIVTFLQDFLDSDTTLKAIIDSIEARKLDKEGLNKEALETQTIVDNPEFIQITIDAERKMLEGITSEGKKKVMVNTQIEGSLSAKKVDIDGATIENIQDPEGRTEIEIDVDGKILSYRDSEGVKHEEAGIKTNHIELSFNATQDLINALNSLGYNANNPVDWSDSEFVEIPIPSICAVVNIETDGQAEAKGVDIPTYIQFWDKSGNYFRKPIVLNAQGSSSMSYHIKNQAIDFTDGSKLKFGNWVPCDSFHIKKYFIDVFRGQCIVGYWLTEQMYQTRPYGERRPWDYLNSFDNVDGANGSFSKDYDTGALAHPDGFPVKVFFNGKNAGVYAFNLKKDRANYYCKKDKQEQIILDGVLGNTFWMANGDLRQQGEEGGNIWHDFEVRNPKISKDINGNKYDGDNPSEPSDNYATTKAAIERLTTAITLVNAETTTEAKKTKFEEFFNIPFLIDYDLIGQVIYNYDGYRKNWIWITNDSVKWCPTSYDMDSIFGQHWNGASYESGSLTSILGTDNNLPTGTNLLKGLYQTEMRARYKELRDSGIFSVDNIVALLEKWVNACGYNNLKEDIEEIVTSPYMENGSVVTDGEGEQVLIPNTPSYRDGTIDEYVYPPATGGWYNSILRVKNWLAQRLQTLDIYFNYNQN